MIEWVKCPRCGAECAHTQAATARAGYCGWCADAIRDSVLESVAAACRLKKLNAQQTGAIVDRVRAVMPCPTDPVSPAIAARREVAAAVGADAWERLVLELDSSPARVEAVGKLRSYRRSVVSFMLESLVSSGVVQWA